MSLVHFHIRENLLAGLEAPEIGSCHLFIHLRPVYVATFSNAPGTDHLLWNLHRQRTYWLHQRVSIPKGRPELFSKSLAMCCQKQGVNFPLPRDWQAEEVIDAAAPGTCVVNGAG